MAQQYGCYALGCPNVTDVTVTNASGRLLQPVESCQAHLGDLLGNVAKAALRENPTGIVTLTVQPLL